MDKPWLAHYPPGMPAEADVEAYASLNEIFASS